MIDSESAERTRLSAQAVAVAERRRSAAEVWARLVSSPTTIVGLCLIGLLIGMAIFGPWIAPYPEDADSVNFRIAFEPPSRAHLFGTDEAGRDVLSRIILGSRISLTVGVLVLVIAVGVGVPVGLVAGYRGGATQATLMRISDVFLSFPPLVLALAVSAFLPRNIFTSVIAISIVWWPWYARLIEGLTLSLKQEPFVAASRSLGASALYVSFREILPNLWSVIVVKASLDVGHAILIAAALGFLGLGVQPPTPEWGTMAASGRAYLPGIWWITTFSGMAIFVAVLAFNLLGDGLRDALDVELS